MTASPTARRDVAAGTLTLLGARLAVALLAMVFIAISTRVLTLKEMAVFAVYNSLCVVQAVICSMGLLTTCSRELPAMMGRGDLDGAARLLRTSLLSNAAASACLAAAMALSAGPLSLLFLKDDSFAPAMRLVAGGVFLWNIFESGQICLIALQRFRHYGKANLACALAQRTLSLAAFAVLAGGGRGLIGYVAGYAVGTIAGIGIQAAAMRDLLVRPGGLAPLRPLLKYAWPFYADGYFRWLYMQADQLLIGIFLAPEVLSLYFVAKRFVQYYQQIVSSSIDPVLAKVAEIRSRGAAAIERSLRSASRYFALAFLPFAAGSAAASVFLLEVAGGAPYRPAALVLALLSISIAVYAAFNLVTGYVYVLGAPSDRLKHNLVAGIAQTVLMTVLLLGTRSFSEEPLAGAAAIAVARIGALLLGLAHAHRQLRRYLVPAYDLTALPPAVGAAALLGLMIFLPQIPFPQPALVPIWATAGIVAFLLVIRRAARHEDLDLLGDLLAGRAPFLLRLAARFFGMGPARGRAAGGG